MTNWVLLKHAEILSTGNSSLSDKGERDSIKIASFLTRFNISTIYSSTSRRCTNTIEPLSDKIDSPIIKSSLLKERRLSSVALNSYTKSIEETFLRPDFSYEGGETINHTKARLLRFLRDTDVRNDQLVAASTHGVNIAILMNLATRRDYLECWSSIREGDCLFFKAVLSGTNLNIKLVRHERIL